MLVGGAERPDCTGSSPVGAGRLAPTGDLAEAVDETVAVRAPVPARISPVASRQPEAALGTAAFIDGGEAVATSMVADASMAPPRPASARIAVVASTRAGAVPTMAGCVADNEGPKVIGSRAAGATARPVAKSVGLPPAASMAAETSPWAGAVAAAATSEVEAFPCEGVEATSWGRAGRLKVTKGRSRSEPSDSALL